MRHDLFATRTVCERNINAQRREVEYSHTFQSVILSLFPSSFKTIQIHKKI